MKWFALVGVVLFVSMSISPSINANIQKSALTESSPLFQIRSKKALHQSHMSLASSFIGESKETPVPISSNKELRMIISYVQDELKKVDAEVLASVLRIRTMNDLKSFFDPGFIQEKIDVARQADFDSFEEIPDLETFFEKDGSVWTYYVPGCIDTILQWIFILILGVLIIAGIIIAIPVAIISSIFFFILFVLGYIYFILSCPFRGTFWDDPYYRSD